MHVIIYSIIGIIMGGIFGIISSEVSLWVGGFAAVGLLIGLITIDTVYEL